MTIELDKITFVNDLFTTMLPNGSNLIINSVDESFLAQGETEECTVKAINIEIIDVDGNTVPCPCVIGLGNELMQISTNYKEYEGEVLTPENRVYCTIEIYE